MQDVNGGFFDSDYDFGGYDSLPNVYSAVTAIAGMALLDARDHVGAGLRPAVEDAVARAANYVTDDHHHNPKDRDEILWSYAYRVRFLARLIETGFGDQQRWSDALNHAVEGLESIQLKNGHWYHEYTNPFVTATALAALHAARDRGGEVDLTKVESGLNALLEDRYQNGAYPYSTRRPGDQAANGSLEASAGRMPICELALWYWGKIDDQQLTQTARISLDHQNLLDVAYKYDNHTSTLAYGGFFFWYDMRGRAELISRIADAPTRRRLATAHRDLILKLPEIDGCFVDSHELGRCYGTSMALLSLGHLQTALATK